MALSTKEKKALKQAGHHLKPVIRVGQKGITESLAEETSLALEKHELIKVQVQQGERDARSETAAELARLTNAEIVHQIGKVFLFYRKNEDA